MITRLFLSFSLLFAFTGCGLKSLTKSPVDNVRCTEGNISFYMKGPQTPFKVLFLSDVHFTVEDERGRDFYKYSKRMGGSAVEPENYGLTNGRDEALRAALDKAKREGVEMVILAGDIVNFPSLASVEWIKRILDESGLKWAYIAGNHDWHYEGEQGSSKQLREKWTSTNLKPLYQGEDPMCYSRDIHGINFVMIDNSTYEISPEQLSFLREEIAKGFPIVLSVHIPLYLPDRHVDFGCGHPDWNRAHDYIYEIESREPWPEEGHTHTTYDFCREVWDSPTVIAVFAGHIHHESLDIFKNTPQFVLGAAFEDSDCLIHFLPAGGQ